MFEIFYGVSQSFVTQPNYFVSLGNTVQYFSGSLSSFSYNVKML
jgi:hypothetical protein